MTSRARQSLARRIPLRFRWFESMGRDPTRRIVLQSLMGFGEAVAGTFSPPAVCTFRVLSLLKPTTLLLRASDNSRLFCVTTERSFVLEGSETIEITPGNVPFRVADQCGSAVSFVLSIPNVIQRSYVGRLQVIRQGKLLSPVVEMDREVAVGSIVGAELPQAKASIEALAAQAVVARSFLAGTCLRRHADADFCDTTHCQFLRSPVPWDSAVAAAVRATARVTLASGSRTFPALYSAACGGTTEGGWRNGFDYKPVNCEVCRSTDSRRRGHGWGMCQEGAMGLASAGWTWRAILAKYYSGAETL